MLGLQTQTLQVTTFSPRLQQAVRLLQMSSLDYARELQDTIESNPFLEIDESQPPAGTGPEGAQESSETIEADWASAARLDHFSTGGAGAGPHHLSHDDSFDVLQGVALPVSLRSHLHAQLGVLRLAERERAFADAVVEALDDDGYLRISLEDIAGAIGDESQSALAELHTALCRVQALDPPGVGARSVAECLTLQLPAIEDPGLRDLARRILRDHIELLASKNLHRLAAALRVPQHQIRLAAECIRKLNARPGWQHSDAAPRLVTPDVMVRKVKGVWTTVLNEAAVPRVQLHRDYATLLERQRRGDNPALRQCLEQARWTVHNVEQRVSTILEVARAIVARQKLFLEYGALAMKPLGLREIAEAVGVHASTVSRTVNNKYLATPFGIFELKYFFSRGLDHTGGGASAPTAVKELIRELIEAESQAAPLSDAELARQLAQQGFRIARRTVTKYRQGLKLESVERRRLA
ncbi:MAG: polymerase, sigma 54 subunit, RpoN [Variovorax sp.]|nr:polymerase, sigma 54 subunit, RpoN [Variovorax sp.]